MPWNRILFVFLMLALLASGIPVTAYSAPQETKSAPCHDTAHKTPEQKPDTDTSHGACKNCVMACCVAQMPSLPAFVSPRFEPTLFNTPTAMLHGVVSAPLTGPPRA